MHRESAREAQVQDCLRDVNEDAPSICSVGESKRVWGLRGCDGWCRVCELRDALTPTLSELGFTERLETSRDSIKLLRIPARANAG